jgi:putative flippase GtrA
MTTTALARFGRFNVTSALGIAVQLAVLWWLVQVLSVNYLVATVTAVAAAVAHNFIWHWRWTWADRAIPLSGAPATFARFAAANGLVSLAGNLVAMAVLVGVLHLPAIAANLISIAACGLVNFWIGDRIVFVERFDSLHPQRLDGIQ